MDERIKEVEYLYFDKGMSGTEIAKEMGYSDSWVYNQLSKLGRDTRTSSETQKIHFGEEILTQMYIDQGLSTHEIADKFEVNAETVRRRLIEHGIDRRDKTYKVAGWNKGKTKDNCESLRKMGERISKTRKKMFENGELIHWNEGNSHNEETKEKISKSLVGRFRGENHPNWRGGQSTELKQLRYRYKDSREYKKWRKNVFERDNYACQLCQKKSEGDIEAHHIIPLEIDKSKIVENNNGITLCISCHRKIRHDEIKYIGYFLDKIKENTNE